MIIKTTLHPIILILFSVFAYSQGNDNEEEDLFSKAHWGISIVPALLEKAHIYGERDKYHTILHHSQVVKCCLIITIILKEIARWYLVQAVVL